MADQRFSALTTDPRYRLPSRKQARTSVDPRFKNLFTDEEFRKKASVDRYGRKIKSSSTREELEKIYRLEKGDGASRSKRDTVESSEEEEEDSIDQDGGTDVVKQRDPARDGGFSDSSSEEETSEEELSDEEAEIAEETAGQEQTEDIPLGEVSRRIAAVNLDWDHIRAADIMAVANSFVPQGGKIERVTIYPSEFGRERMEREEIEGPPREIFTSSKNGVRDNDSLDDSDSEEGTDGSDDEPADDDDDNDEKIKKKLLEAQTEGGSEFDTAKLRQYQLERLRYYYAVIACNNNATSKALYDAMDGREYLSTSNFFDLRFIPDDTSFDDDRPHDECSRLASGYKPNDFRTEALTHSKVRLTWDEDDATRKEVQKRAFSRAELNDEDLNAYIGSDSSDAESTTSRKSAGENKRLTKKEAEKAKMRAALGLSLEPTKPTSKGKDEVVGDMQITFTSGLSGGKDGEGVFENEPQDEESTRQRYIRKERERKLRRKEKFKATRAEEKSAEKATEEESDEPEVSANAEEGEDDPFDDPFFKDPSASAKLEQAAKKAAKMAKRSAAAADEEAAKSRRAELELLMADDTADGIRHFDIREIEKAEKLARRKGKKGKKRREDDEMVKDDFKIETQDPRFKALYAGHEFAIDPTNPQFKKTENMKALLEEGRKKRKAPGDEGITEGRDKVKKVKDGGADAELNGLVARLKDKSKVRR